MMTQQVSSESWPENLFLLYPENRDFIEGKSRKIVGGNLIWWLTSGCFLAVVTLLPMFIFAEATKAGISEGAATGWDLDTTLKVLAVFGVPMLVAAPFAIRVRSQNRLLAETGKLIRGAVVNSRPGWVSSKNSMTVVYAFISPQGQELSGQDTIMDFSTMSSGSAPSFAWPAGGTPVAVLYANDKLFRIM
jgi:hypothetical protein